jgi:hypothetical protein
MFGPKAISPASPPSRFAIASCAARLSASVSTELPKAPPEFALPRSRCSAMRRMPARQACVPPGASK